MTFKPVDIIVGIMALSITVTILLISLMPYVLGVVMTEDKAKLVASLLGSVISIISMYVGAQIRDGHRSKNGRQNDTRGSN